MILVTLNLSCRGQGRSHIVVSAIYYIPTIVIFTSRGSLDGVPSLDRLTLVRLNTCLCFLSYLLRLVLLRIGDIVKAGRSLISILLSVEVSLIAVCSIHLLAGLDEAALFRKLRVNVAHKGLAAVGSGDEVAIWVSLSVVILS
jgi:hypothetical protein